MSGLDNKTVLQKADLALADIAGDNGVLLPAQAKEFIRLLIKQSKVLGMATVTPLKAPKQIVNKIRFNSRVLRRGYEGTALPDADRSKPDFSNVEHDAQLFKAEVRITNETLEDNIEGDSLRNTIMSLLSEAVSRDMEEVIVNGDSASADSFLAAFDGIRKLATSNIVNAGTVNLSKTTLRDMLKALPSQYLRNKDSMRFLTSVDAEIDYRDSLSTRETVVGDAQFSTSGTSVVGYSGVPVIDVPVFLENLGAGTNCTEALLVDPKNIDVGIWRQIRIETDKDISEGVLKIVASVRFDALYQVEEAVVKAQNVKVT